MQRVLLSSVAAGGVVSTLSAATAEAQAPTNARRQLTLTIDRRRPPKLDELVAIVSKAISIYGCTDCGFGGIDVRVKLESIVNPRPTGWVAAIE